MQSQKQKERQENNVHGQEERQIQIATSTTCSSTSSSVTLTAKSSPNKDSGGGPGGVDFLPINDDTKLNIKDELDLEDLDDKFLNDFTSDSAKITSDIKLEIDDIEMDEFSAATSNTPQTNTDDKENEIHIDPKTYCKLGHFHLLLEEFDKGLNLICLFNVIPLT